MTEPTAGTGDQDGFAWPPQNLQAASTPSDLTGDSPQELPGLELNRSFPFSDVHDEPLHEQPVADATSMSTEPLPLDEEPDLAAAAARGVHVTTPAATEAASPARKPVGPRQMAMLGGALVAASALIFTILSMRPSASPEPSAQPVTPAAGGRPAANRAPSSAARTTAMPRSTPLAPKWNHVTGGRWTGGDKKSVAFELQANNRIHIWTRDVTPLLIVRCRAGQVEPFVYTQSAARMEPQDGDHTVRVAFDDGPEVTERWPDSDEHDALFARDAAAFTQQLATAQTLRFGFEPHNAPPASAQFDVSGIHELLSAAKACGGKR